MKWTLGSEEERERKGGEEEEEMETRKRAQVIRAIGLQEPSD